MGCKIIGIEHTNGKICPKNILPHLKVMGDQHSAQPKVISITQPTELGTVYLPEEIKTLAELAHKHNMYLHIDGARLSNACVKLGKSFKEMTADCDIDILSFGGTKNGMMIGESVIFFNQKLSIDFQYVRKNMLQLYSKMRFIACQFEAFLSNDLWKLNAIHANIMAQKLENLLNQMPIIKITAPPY
jgi:threonine aldolase